MKLAALAAAILATQSIPIAAAEISTHVLDLRSGVGGKDVPVTLSKRAPDGTWKPVATARTDANGRVKGFGPGTSHGEGAYRLQFDMSAYPDASAAPFFPEITLTFRVAKASEHYHVPVVVSPFGYSTYRGN